MKKCTIRNALVSVVLAGVCGLSAPAGAQEPVSAPPVPAADSSVNRPVVMKAIKVGGLRSGEVVITQRGAEIVTPGSAVSVACVVVGAVQ